MRTRLFSSLFAAGLLVLSSACDGGDVDELVPTPLEGDVSTCGGFESMGQPVYGTTADYCDEEVLHWSWSEETGRLELAHARVLLNCCGEHSAEITLEEDDLFILNETDAPEAEGGRCNCQCVYDFRAAVENVFPETLTVRIVREVTDSEQGPVQVFETTLEPSAREGAIVVDPTDVSPWCEAP